MNREVDPDAVLEFIRDSFQEVDESRHPEIRIYCPFCNGGQYHEYSFDININDAVARCWRQSCDWRGPVEKMVMDLYGWSYEKAKKVIGIQSGYTLDHLELLMRGAERSLEEFQRQTQAKWQTDVKVFPSDATEAPKDDSALKQWVENVRGYDFSHFMDDHRLYFSDRSRFAGRVLFKITTGPHEAYLAYAIHESVKPKTLNPPGKVLSKMLYNYEDAKKEGNVLFVCEGIMDVARLKSWGYKAVAVFGVNVSADQATWMRKTGASEICMCFDNGAEKKAFSAARMLAHYIPDKKISVLLIEREGADPDDITEEEFVEYYSKRRVHVREEARLDTMLDDLQKRWE